MVENPNASRGPWCVICGAEMNRPNHRFQATVNDENGMEAYRYHGGEVMAGFLPICGEVCLIKALSEWASPPKQSVTPSLQRFQTELKRPKLIRIAIQNETATKPENPAPSAVPKLMNPVPAACDPRAGKKPESQHLVPLAC